ncbi:unnamed protein product [Caenorhabditis angaria]|uniref:Uncharacterized protein n=1 Tax=Caenorhabditis angaria TaxID=860376 RepID=A0A9P1MY11_9PELO|nr:unnamed protein product [Caenorhabditis angaria]
MSGRRLPPLSLTSVSSQDSQNPPRPPIHQQTTPNSEQIRQILEQRINQAMTGPHKEMLNGRRRSLIRSSAIGSEDMRLVPIDQEELSMLRSINKSQNSTSQELPADLAKHEYEDKSEDEAEEGESSAKTRRKMSMVRQEELEEKLDELGAIRKTSAIRNLEDRLSGYRHEKMRSSTKSGDFFDDEQITGLVYDMDFDCYYNPQTDTYYRLKSMSKNSEEEKLQQKINELTNGVKEIL